MECKGPTYNVIAIPIEEVQPNNYNPNRVAPPEMRLLYKSIKEDRYTIPVICYYAKTQDVYLIANGFHRYRVVLDHPDIYGKEREMLLVSVIGKSTDKRMVSTVHHNKAHGFHGADSTSNIVKELHEFGCSDMWTAKHLGMDRGEVLRLRQIIGLTALSRDIKFGEVWRPVEE